MSASASTSIATGGSIGNRTDEQPASSPLVLVLVVAGVILFGAWWWKWRKKGN